MSERKPILLVFCATTNTGKTYRMKKYLGARTRNLILPANKFDCGKAWEGIPELKWEVRYEADPMNPRGGEKPFVHIPELHTFTGNRVINVGAERRIFEAIIHPDRGFTNGGLMIDDFRKYVPGNGRLAGDVAEYFSGHRHRMVDVYLACHALQDVNAQFLQWQAEMRIGYLTLPPNDLVQEKVKNWEELAEVIDRVYRENQNRPEKERHYFERFIPA